jgi:hypothetical protein
VKRDKWNSRSRHLPILRTIGLRGAGKSSLSELAELGSKLKNTLWEKNAGGVVGPRQGLGLMGRFRKKETLLRKFSVSGNGNSVLPMHPAKRIEGRAGTVHSVDLTSGIIEHALVSHLKT